jgi:DNA-binding GntR family transcriptional regulator
MCAGAGSIERQDVHDLQRLREQMQRVADAMQAGDAGRAADACRKAASLARPLLAKHR